MEKEDNVPLASDKLDVLVILASEIVQHIRDEGQLKHDAQAVLTVAEEAGELVGAYRRAAGMARRSGSWSDVSEEMADVVIAAFTAADILNIDLKDAIKNKLDKIFTRGWNDK